MLCQLGAILDSKLGVAVVTKPPIEQTTKNFFDIQFVFFVFKPILFNDEVLHKIHQIQFFKEVLTEKIVKKTC